MNFDSTKLTFSKFSCLSGGNDTCATSSVTVAGHTIKKEDVAAGKAKLMIFHASAPETAVTQAYMSGGVPQGNALVMDIVFTLAQAIPGETPVKLTVTDAVAFDAEVNELTVALQNDVLVTSTSAPEPKCPDGVCNGAETCQTCAADCGQCCGNKKCDFGETCTTCPGDCGACPVCGDNVCNGAETCSTCAKDCGACPPEAWCNISGAQGATGKCILKLAAASNTSPKATSLDFILTYDSTALAFSKFSCLSGGNDTCGTSSVTVSGHTIKKDEASPGKMKVMVYHAGAPETANTQAYLSGGNVQGDPKVFEIVFTLSKTIAAQSPTQPSLSDIVAFDAEVNELKVTMQNWVLVTSVQ